MQTDPMQMKESLEAAARALQAGRLAEAEGHTLNVLLRTPGEPMASQIMGVIRIRQERFDEAIEYLEAGLANAPQSAALPNLLGAAEREKGNLKNAYHYFEKAAAAAPENPTPFENMGKAAFDLGKWAEARDAFERCRALDRVNVEALLGLARIELLANNDETARDLAQQVLALHPENTICQHVMAEVELRKQNPERALDIATGIWKNPRTPPPTKMLACGTAADAADKLGRYDEAFALYEAANAIAADFQRDALKKAQSRQPIETLADLAAITPELAKQAAAWPRRFNTPAPVFFMGFARSGTTLLEQILTSHPLIESVEEGPFVEAAKDILDAPDMPDRIAALGGGDVEPLRQRYWEAVASLGVTVPEGGVLLDWQPFYSLHLALIAMIFPDAKILFAIRDPRDVVLSCFQQRFAPSRSMIEFLELESAARFYDLSMRAAKAARGAFDLNLSEVRYENVVADLEAEARRLIDFIALPWDDAVLSYRKNSSKREIKTPSAPQVAKPVYSGAIGKWRNYEKHMAPVREVLDPWAQRFGYD